MLIYKVTNIINLKIYIGMTKKTLEERIKSHLDSINDGTYFQRALLKYGEQSFIWDVIDSTATTINELKNLEKYYISMFKSHSTENGYNMTIGGDTSWELGREKSIKTVSLFDINGNYIKTYQSLTEGAADKNIPLGRVSYSATRGHPTYNTRWQFGSSSIYSHSLRPRGRIIYQFDSSGVYIREYENSKVAMEETGICATVIRSCANGLVTSSGGYFWSYDKDQCLKNKKIRTPKDKRPIEKLDSDGAILAEFRNYSAITSEGSYRAQIRASIERNTPCKNGFYWRRKDV